MIKPLVMAWGCLFGATAWAETTELPSEVDYFAAQPVVLSASRLAQPVSRAPAAVTVITREMIEASGFRQLPDLLRLVPGFQVTWARGNIQAATYQGMSSIYSRRLQVTVDGRSVYNPAYGQVQWRGIPLALEDIDRIEVVRGPNAANDGINAVQASIHIYTKPAAMDLGLTLGAWAGSRDVRDGLVRHAGGSGDWQWRVSLSSRADDWINNSRDDARDHFIDARAEWRPDERDELTFQAGGVLGEWDNSAVGYTFSDRQTSDFANGYAQFSWRRALSRDSEWHLLINHTHTRSDEFFPPISFPPFGMLSPDNLNYWFSRSALEFSWQTRPSDDLRTVVTAEARHDRAWSASLAGPDTHQGTLYRLSGTAEWSPADEWVLHAGAMLEHHYYAGTRLSPRVALNWLPIQGHSFRIGASRAYRSPTFLEQEADFKLTVGPVIVDQILLSPYHLKPERMDSTELGYLYHRQDAGLDLDVRLFQNRFRDLIDAGVPLPVVGEIAGNGADFTYDNLYRARQLGAEYQLRWKPEETTWLTLAQAWTRIDADLAELRETAPSHTVSLLASHDFGVLKASLGYYRLGKMTWLGSPQTPAYDRLDVRLAKAFMIGETRAELSLVAQSVLGKYSEFAHNRLFEPRAYVSLKLHF